MISIKKILKPVFSTITGHCLGAIGIGIVVATVAAFGILHWQGADEASTVTATYTIRLPQDEEMLKKLSDEILEGTDVAGEDAARLTDIAPAAGSDTLPAE